MSADKKILVAATQGMHVADDTFAERPGRARAALLGSAVAMPLLAGAFFLLFYTYPLKKLGLGEPAVLLVWGLVAYRIISSLNNDEPAYNNVFSNVVPMEEDVQPESFSLRLDYRDPFLTGRPRKRAQRSVIDTDIATPVAQPVTPAVQQPEPDPEPVMDWSPLAYVGLIQRSGSSNNQAPVALVSINGSSRMVKTGDEIDGYAFTAVTKDSLMVTYGQFSTVIYKGGNQ